MLALSPVVRVLCDGKPVAEHDRIWARHQTITDPAHTAAAKALRRERITVVRPVRAMTDVRARISLLARLRQG